MLNKHELILAGMRPVLARPLLQQPLAAPRPLPFLLISERMALPSLFHFSLIY